MLIERIKDNLKEGDIKSAYNYCEKLNTPVSRVLAKGVKDYRFDNASIRQALDNYAGLEIARLEKGLPVISTISAVAPMLGFLGTVTGMVEAFWQMSHAGNDIQVSALSGGIYEAMVTTVGGLVVGIIAIFAYNYLVSRVDKVQNMMEAQIIAFLEVVVECKENIDPLKEFAQNADNEEYVAQRMEQPVTEPETQPIAKPAAKPAAQPVAKPAAKPAAQPAAQPVAKPAAKPATQPVARPAAKPVAKTAAAPVSKVDVTESDMNA